MRHHAWVRTIVRRESFYDVFRKTVGPGYSQALSRARPIPNAAYGWECPGCGTIVLSLDSPRPVSDHGGSCSVEVSLKAVDDDDPDRDPVPDYFPSVVPADCFEARDLRSVEGVLGS